MLITKKTWWLILPIAVAWISLLIANLDIRAGRHMLFMDEVIFFDNSKSILAAQTPSDFWYAFLIGPDQRYGQIGFVVTACTGWLPWLIAGDSGLILAIRMTCASALLAAYGLLGWCVIRLRPSSSWLGVIMVVMCVVLPSTVYYGTMPKPEPFQLLLLAGYVALSVHRKALLGWHALLLGGVFGAKISGLPVVCGFFVLNVVHNWLTTDDVISQRLRRAILGFAWIVLGAIVCEPAMLLDRETYLNSTFRNTAHGSDDPANGMLSWLHLIGGGLMPFAGWWWWMACVVAGSVTGL